MTSGTYALGIDVGTGGAKAVLVDGDDMNDPVADAVRGILDGHIVLSRKLAHSNHFPAIDVLQSVSRVMPRVMNSDAVSASYEARALLSAYREVEDLLRVGAYSKGSDPRADRAIAANDTLRSFLTQGVHETLEEEAAQTLQKLLGAQSSRA